MAGDTADMLARLKGVLPAGWFSDSTPVLDALLSGCASAWSWIYDLLQTVRSQSRLTTSSGNWIDVWALDYLGPEFVRKGRSDPAFIAAIKQEMLRERATRSAIATVLQDLTGRPPLIFEATRPSDTGAYASPGGTPNGLAYGIAGGWGNLDLPYQALIIAYRPAGAGIPCVTGWGQDAGGYGQGAIEYGDLEMVGTEVSDQDIYQAIASVMPVAATAWTRISN